MKRACILLVIIFGIPNAFSDEKKYLKIVESNVIKYAATKKEIFNKAKECIVDYVEYSAVNINNGITDMFSGKNTENITSNGQVLAYFDLDSGKIIANSRVDYSRMMISHNTESKMTFIAKDGRFKIRHTNIKHLQKSTGSLNNNGYTKVGLWWGSGSEPVIEALNGVTSTISDCITGKASEGQTQEDDW